MQFIRHSLILLGAVAMAYSYGYNKYDYNPTTPTLNECRLLLNLPEYGTNYPGYEKGIYQGAYAKGRPGFPSDIISNLAADGSYNPQVGLNVAKPGAYNPKVQSNSGAYRPTGSTLGAYGSKTGTGAYGDLFGVGSGAYTVRPLGSGAGAYAGQYGSGAGSLSALSGTKVASYVGQGGSKTGYYSDQPDVAASRAVASTLEAAAAGHGYNRYGGYGSA